MIVFNGKKYAKNDNEMVESLFHAGGTCVGFYKTRKDGVLLSDLQKIPRVFLVNRPNEKFAVSAHKTDDGKIRFMFGICSLDEEWVGLTGLQNTYDAIESINRGA